VAVIVIAGVLTLRWSGFRDSATPRGRGLLQFTAICLGLLLLFVASSRDRTEADSVKANIAAFQSRIALAEITENRMASQIEKLESANKDLDGLLKQSSAQKKEAAEEAKRLREALIEAAKTVADVVQNPNDKSISLRIKEAVLFDFDKSDLSCESKEKLSKVIGFLTYQVRTPRTQIQVFGHTDSTGSDSHDDKLSGDRASEVKNYFIGSGIPAEIVTATPMGKRQPVGFTGPQSPEVIRRENVTEEQRKKNRRVEIVVSSSS